MSKVAPAVIYSAKTSPVPDFLKQQLWLPEQVDNALPWFRNYFHIWPDFLQEKFWPNLRRLNALFPAQQEELSFIENPPKQRRRKRKLRHQFRRERFYLRRQAVHAAAPVQQMILQVYANNGHHAFCT